MPESDIRVLVADAEALFSEALGIVLARTPGLAVLDERPRSGVDAINVAATRRPDVAVVDLWLREMRGVATTRLMRANTPRVRIVMLAWFHGPDEVQQARDAGAVAVVGKNAQAAEVVQAVHEAYAAAEPAPGGWDGGANGSAADGEADAVWRRLHTLTPRELETLRLIAAGLPKEDVADRLGVSEQTARTHINRLLAKTETHTQMNAVAVARQHGVLT